MLPTPPSSPGRPRLRRGFFVAYLGVAALALAVRLPGSALGQSLPMVLVTLVLGWVLWGYTRPRSPRTDHTPEA